MPGKTEMRKNVTLVVGLKLIGSQLLFGFISLILITGTLALFGGEVAPDALTISVVPIYYVIPSLLTWVFFSMSSYTESWYMGDREINLVKYGHSVYNARKGLMVGLVPHVIGVLAALCAIILGPNGTGQWATAFARMYYAVFLWLFAIFDPLKYPWVYFVPLLVQPWVSQWGYRNGYRLISLYRKFVYVNPEKKKRK